MKIRDVVWIQLEARWGTKFPQEIQRMVDEELARGAWEDGYGEAICHGVVVGAGARILLGAVLRAHEDWRIGMDELEINVAMHLPQWETSGELEWFISEEGGIFLSDGLKVARFSKEKLVWKTPRLSLDGIALDYCDTELLKGRAWNYYSESQDFDSPFILNARSGELLAGEVPSF